MKEILNKLTVVQLRNLVKQYNEKYSIPAPGNKAKGELIDHIIKYAKNKEDLKSMVESLQKGKEEDKIKGVPKKESITLKSIPKNLPNGVDRQALENIRDRALKKIERIIAKYEELDDSPVPMDERKKRDSEIKLVKMHWEERLKKYLS